MEIVDDPKTLANFSNDDGILNGLEFPQDVEEALKEVKETFYLLIFFNLLLNQHLCPLCNSNVIV